MMRSDPNLLGVSINMTTLFQAVNQSGTTHNGMTTNLSSMNKCVDLFFMIGASRGKNIIPEFAAAMGENADVATRILQWTRDAREGAGERKQFRDLILYMVSKQPQSVGELLPKIPVLGRWDDMLIFLGTAFEAQALDIIKTALVAGDSLCAKWMPRPTGKHKAAANTIRKALGLSPKAYRQLLANMSHTVEQQMCAKQWNEIDFSKVPSVASARYQKAFGKNAAEKYGKFIDALEKGEVKINAGALYPYDVLKSVATGNARVADQQWLALPNYMEGSNERILPVVDVSGSMGAPAGGSASVTCMDVAISLGLYLAERQEGPFKDQFITFSEDPQMQKVTGTLSQRIDQMRRADWGMSTNLESVFDLILRQARACSVQESQMPTKIIIFSDMEFNAAIRKETDAYGWGRSRKAANPPAMAMIEQQYAEAGFKMPQVVFWNLNARPGNVPVAADKSGAALVSGFSPSILTSLLGDDTFTPEGIMLKTVMVPRYDL